MQVLRVRDEDQEAHDHGDVRHEQDGFEVTVRSSTQVREQRADRA